MVSIKEKLTIGMDYMDTSVSSYNSGISSIKASGGVHYPVMYREVLSYLDCKPGKVIVDATVGTGGHAYKVLKKISPGGSLIGIDKDQDSLAVARERLSEFKDRFILIHEDFRHIDHILNGIKVDGVLFDLGISSFQLRNQERGFSFQQDSPLDMRMDRTNSILAYDLVNSLAQSELSHLIKVFGEDRFHNRIAKYIVRKRKEEPIATTFQLSELIKRAVPSKRQHIHPATRTFQALRIAVNRELESLEEALEKLPLILKSGSRACVISFHSLEDRIVKHRFRYFKKSGMLKVITPKPLRPSSEEMKENIRSRSAKMRVAQKK